MKIDSKILSNFFQKVYCDGTLNECIIDFKTDKIVMTSRDPANLVLINVEMKAPKVYTPLGKLGFRNLGIFVKYLDRFNGEIDVNVEGNLLVLKQNDRVIEYILADEQAIQYEEGLSYSGLGFLAQLEYDTLSSRIFKDAAANFETLKTYKMEIKSVNGKLIITTGDSESDRITESCSTNIKNANTKIGEASIKIIKKLPDTVKIGIAKDIPLVFESEEDGIIFNCVIAPRVEEK